MFRDLDLKIGGRVKALLVVGFSTGLLAMGAFVLVSYWLKTSYYRDSTFFFSAEFGRHLAGSLYTAFWPLRIVWGFVPVGDPTLEGMVFNWPFALFVVMLLVALALSRHAWHEYEVVNEVVKLRSIARREGRKQNQSVGHVQAGGDVTIQQHINEQRLADMQQQGWTNLMIAVAGIVIAAVITYIFGLTH